MSKQFNDPSGFKIIVEPTYRQIDTIKTTLFDSDIEPNFANVTTVLNAVKEAYKQQLDSEQEYLIESLLEDGELKATLKEVK